MKRLAALLVVLACPSWASTSVTVAGNSYTIPDHPRVLLDGPGGTITTRVKDPDGAGPLVAPQATDANPAFVALKTSIRGCISVSPVPCPAITDPTDIATFVLLAALDWYMDNSQTNSLAAAKYWLNHIEDFVNPQATSFGFGCDVTQLYCGISSWGDWPSYNLGLYGFAYTLIRDQFSAGEKTALAQKMFNDVTAGYEDSCTNQLQQEVGATATYTSGSTAVSGTSLSGLTAGRRVWIRATTGGASAVGGWATIQSVNSAISITLTGAPQYPLGGNAASVTSGYIYELKPWTSSTCGLVWQMHGHNYNPRGRSAGYVATTLSATIDTSQTSIGIASAAGLPASTPYYMSINSGEIVKVTNRSGTTLTVTRGQFFTTPTAVFSGKPIYYTRYIPNVGQADAAHNLVVEKLFGYVLAAIAWADDSANALAYVDTASDDWLTLVQPKLIDMWTGFQQSGSSNYGAGRQLTENTTIAYALKQFTGTPSLDKTSGNWLKNPIYAFLYLSLPAAESVFVPWGQPDIAATHDYYTNQWAAIAAGIYTAADTAVSYWNYWQRTVANQYTSAIMTSGAGERIIPYALLFWQESDASVNYKAVLPTQRAFNSVDGNSSYALNGWVSRTGWSSASDTLVFANGFTSAWSSDHISTGPTGAYKIYKQGWTLGENGAGDTGIGVDTNMPFFSGAANQASTRPVTMDYVLNDDVSGAYSYVRFNLGPGYATAAAATRALRSVVHFKKSGTQDYIVAYDDLASSSGRTKGVNLYYDKTSGQATAMTDSTAPTLVWTGPNRRISTTVVLPAGAGLVGTSTSPTNSYKIALCPSGDGSTCDSTNTSTEFLMAHRPSTDITDSMPTVTALGTIDSNFVGIQIEGTDPKVAVFAKANGSQSSATFTTTHSGTAQILVAGLAPGVYDFKRGAVVVCDDYVVTSASHALYCESTSGAMSVVDTGAPPPDPIIIDAAPLTAGTVGTPYSKTFTSIGGTGSGKVWSITAGAAPDGLSLSSGGDLIGTPTLSGAFTFTVHVVDSGANTANQEFSLTINSVVSDLLLTGSAEASATAAVLTFGGAGLANDASCAGTVTAGSNTVATFTNASGSSRRKQSVSNLNEATSYGVRIDCTASQTLSFSFLTPDAPATPSTSLTLSLKPSAGLATADRVTVEYGVNDVTENSTTQTGCSSGCTVTLSGLTNGVYQIRHTWKNSGGTAVAPASAIRYVLLK